MNRDTLFLRTLEDLGRRVEPGVDEYEVLLIAGLLRKLLVDSPRLVDEVNRSRGLRIRYVINASRPIWELAGSPAPVFWSIQDALDPDAALTRPEPKEVSLDEFLVTVVMRVRAESVSVKDVILHTANVVGAVHAGKARKDVNRLLEKVADEMSIGDFRPDVRSLLAIARVALRAMAPLGERIEAEAR